ncbi:CMP-Neu5Ac--lipooligosaccharide alpha 2-3 sialyltransferase [[Haemophilus] felis]|nr:CMP-Neu5Ac--lipooligosaccharide alpha 2-3 sialyltransferase [[Haemophilus] felis]
MDLWTHSTAQHSTAQHSTAQHSTAQHSTAQHSTAQHKSINHSNKKSVVIAGNGKSLSQIDYRLLPEDFDVFRCNQFYFEDHYFLGKSVKAAFFNSSLLFEQYYTFHHLIHNNEYQCENLVVSSFHSPLIDFDTVSKFKLLFPHIIDGYDYLAKLSAFDEYLRFNELYRGSRITSGVYMCAVAIAAGYQDIYLTGIDFYAGGNTSYAFDHKKENIIKLVPNFKENISHSQFHTQNTDIEALKFLQSRYQVNIYSISPTSPISSFFPLASAQNPTPFDLKKKENYTKDILIPLPDAYAKFQKIFPRYFETQKLRSNLIYRLIKDLLHLPSHIKHYLRDKKKKF